MNKSASPYYPPRAKWYSPLFQIGNAVRRRAYLDRIQLPAGVSFRDFITSLWWPGIAFYVRGEKLIGSAVICGSALLAMIFIVWLGYPAANVAFGLLLSAHVTSILFLFNPWLTALRFRFRVLFAIAILILMGGLVYAPLRNQLQARWLMPLRLGARVVVVQRMAAPDLVRRGDWIAYTIPAIGGAGVRVQQGLGLGPVLAEGGDHIRFTRDGFEVTGIVRPLLPHMPVNGELVVPEKHWFVWPDLAISAYGNAGETPVAATMLQLATIAEAQFIGKPFKRWFWRHQLPEARNAERGTRNSAPGTPHSALAGIPRSALRTTR